MSHHYTGEKAHKGSNLVLKPRADVTRSPKEGYQWLNEKNLYPPKKKKKKVAKSVCWNTKRSSNHNVNSSLCNNNTKAILKAFGFWRHCIKSIVLVWHCKPSSQITSTDRNSVPLVGNRNWKQGSVPAQWETIEFILNVFTEFSKFNDKNNVVLKNELLCLNLLSLVGKQHSTSVPENGEDLQLTLEFFYKSLCSAKSWQNSASIDRKMQIKNCPQSGLNPQPPDLHSNTLPTELGRNPVGQEISEVSFFCFMHHFTC